MDRRREMERKKKDDPSREDQESNDFHQPDAFMEHDRQLRENPMKTVPNRYVSKTREETGTVDPEEDVHAEVGDHFDVTWEGPDLPQTSTQRHPRKKRLDEDTEEECPE